MALEGRTLVVECPCPGTPHEHDTVTFSPVLPMAGGLAVISAVRDAMRATDGEEMDNLVLAAHTFPVYLRFAIESWTFTDAAGHLLDRERWDALLPFGVKYAIADAADDLFGEEALSPLVGTTPASSRGGPTATSTSRSRASGSSPRSRSAPSSRAASAASEP